MIEDAIAEGTWLDLATQDVTSVALNDIDLNKLVTFILKKLKIGQDKVTIYDDTILFCQAFKEKIMQGRLQLARCSIWESDIDANAREPLDLKACRT